ncbi:unnamed protein product [Cyprideis torosa]|uniref:Uncharacterized protein n=1 Tax=Cyprideis torosa TaxID=163714 RepID=A0A7R8WGH8_9CRUS|nr:unnamed protein product [Cyprideis torosa]CAG0893012.1 unnamed protein product [Cyprideis torosa]
MPLAHHLSQGFVMIHSLFKNTLLNYRHMLVLKDWHDLNDPMIAPFRGLNTIYTLFFVWLIMVILSSDRVLDCLSHHDGYLFQSLKSKNGDENGIKLFKRNNEKFL